ncbi:glycosyltransferase family 2 protein [Halosimplex amylolyticum]|uniref:glycosyltransferase family 2 protein n=1 Tax=Halosimplex amylolyticum TaxID=3396616 RepID=UPI003F572B02
MSSIALGAVVFKRTDMVEQLLSSVSSPVETVYIADNGEISPERRRIYDRSYPFELKVLDLEYDSGLGHGRNEIVEQLSEDYVVIVDSDMTMPHGIEYLADQLDERPRLGGVSGLLFEHGNLIGASCDLYEEGEILIKDIRGTKDSEFVDGKPFVEFDFVPNAAMFRRECLEEYSWDPAYKFGAEHLDFFVAHKKRTDWTFGTCPAVVFPHFPGGDAAYLSARMGIDEDRPGKSLQYFLDKWGYRHVLKIQPRWADSFSNPALRDWRFLVGYGARMALRRLPTRTTEFVLDIRDRIDRG